MADVRNIKFELTESEYAHYCIMCAEYQPLLKERSDLIIERDKLNDELFLLQDIDKLRADLARSQKTLKGIRWHILGLDSGALGRSPGGFSYRNEMVDNIGIVLNKTEGKS